MSPSCIVSKIVIGWSQKPSYWVGQFSSSAAFFLICKIEELQGEIKGCLLLGRKSMSNLDSVLKSRDITADKGLQSQSYGFSSSYVWMWELDHKESRALKNWCFQIVVLETALESPLDSKDTKPVNPKGNQPWIFTRGTDAGAEAPIIWPPDVMSQLIGKDSDAGQVWGQEEKGQQRKRWLDGITDSMDMS